MPNFIEKRRRKWYAILDIPKDVRATIGKGGRFVKSLDTDSQSVALRRVGPLVAKWKGKIEAARKGSHDPIEMDIRYWREALSDADDHSEEGGSSERDLILSVLQDKAEEKDRKGQGDGMQFFKRATGQLIDTCEYVEEWLASLLDIPKTIDMKRNEMERFSKEFPTLDTVTKKAVKRWCVMQMTSDTPLKVRTINKNLSFIRSYWSYLVSIEVVGDEYKPLHDLGLASKNSKRDETVPFSSKDVVRIRTKADGKHDQELVDLITLGMWTGARIHELCSMKIEDFGAVSFKIEDAKTDAGWREVPIHSKLQPTVDRLIKNSTDDYLLSGLPANKYGDRSNAIGKRFGGLKESMGFKSRVEVFHSIRGTVATLLENAGVPEGVAADIIGHDKPTMTYGLYSGGASLEVKRKALEKIGYPNR